MKQIYINDVRDNYEKGNYSVNESWPYPVTRNHVFDENLSIKENRELIEKFNCQVAEKRLAISQEKQRRQQEMRNDVVAAIAYSNDLTERQSIIIERYAWNIRHDCIRDYFDEAEELAEMVCDVLRAGE